MRLAYLAPITVDTIVTARKLGFDALEVAAGWLDRPTLQEVEANLPTLKSALKDHGIAVTAVGIYGGTIEAPLDDAVGHWARAMRVARALGCDIVAGLTGRDNSRTVDDNLADFKDYFDAIVAEAEDLGVRIALEPWPGKVLGHGPYRWTNLACSPELWGKLFQAVPSPLLGLEYDPSHLIWQAIDHLQAIRDYGERIFHVQAKDILIDDAALKRMGVHGRGWWRSVIPGLGQIDWPKLFETLRSVGYQGDITLEHEDNQYFERRWNEGLTIGLKTLRPLVEVYR